MTDYPVTLVLGGARSGKSGFAERRALKSGKALYYVATAEARDGEMAERIERHRAQRGNGWRTIEETRDLADVIDAHAGPDNILVIDCLTLWLSNIMGAGLDIDTAVAPVIAALAEARGPVICVANEVGLSIVPDNALARAFRDEAGRLNQAVARAATDVIFMAAGLPLYLKKNNRETGGPA